MFSEITHTELITFVELIESFENQWSEIFSIDEGEEISKGMTDIIRCLGSWSHLYEADFISLVTQLVAQLQMGEKLKSAVIDKKKPTEILKVFEENDYQYLASDDTHLTAILQYLACAHYSVIAIKCYGVSMSELIIRVRQGDMEALRMAVRIDHSCVANPTIASWISLAAAMEDTEFFNSLANQLKGKPQARWKSHNRLRFALAILDQKNELDGYSTEALYDLLIDQCKFVDDNGVDSLASFGRFVRRWKKDTRTKN